jgi:putative hydrolase of the HAD superfamily
MSNERWIAFDADDTLWHNENIFERVQARFYELLARHHDAATVKRALDAVETRNLDLYGYGVKGFMLSSIETAIEVTDGKVSPEEVRELLALGRGMLAHPVELLDGAAEVLDTLAGDYALLLITKGDLRDQERKLSKSGLAGRFKAVEIVSEKDEGTYGRILQRHAIARGCRGPRALPDHMDARQGRAPASGGWAILPCPVAAGCSRDRPTVGVARRAAQGVAKPRPLDT